MKAIITFLLSASFLPVALSAQPVMTENEFYNTGEIITMVNCNTSGISAGAAGAGVMWDFSSLTASGMLTTSVLHDTSSLFSSSSSLMEIMPNGTIDYVAENSANTYINGIENSTSNIITYYDNYDISKCPFTFNTSYADTYYVNIPSSATYGSGYLAETGDAYGTLILPTGTYNNVLRIRKVQQETDTTGSESIYTITVSYLWFDTNTNAPLLRIDSISSQASESQSVTYLSAIETGISSVNKYEEAYSSYFDNGGNLVVDGFEAGQSYEVTMYNIIGNKFFAQDFSATDKSQRFDIVRPLPPGIYLVSIANKNESSANAMVIKVIKND